LVKHFDENSQSDVSQGVRVVHHHHPFLGSSSIHQHTDKVINQRFSEKTGTQPNNLHGGYDSSSLHALGQLFSDVNPSKNEPQGKEQESTGNIPTNEHLNKPFLSQQLPPSFKNHYETRNAKGNTDPPFIFSNQKEQQNLVSNECKEDGLMQPDPSVSQPFFNSSLFSYEPHIQSTLNPTTHSNNLDFDEKPNRWFNSNSEKLPREPDYKQNKRLDNEYAPSVTSNGNQSNNSPLASQSTQPLSTTSHHQAYNTPFQGLITRLSSLSDINVNENNFQLPGYTPSPPRSPIRFHPNSNSTDPISTFSDNNVNLPSTSVMQDSHFFKGPGFDRPPPPSSMQMSIATIKPYGDGYERTLPLSFPQTKSSFAPAHEALGVKSVMQMTPVKVEVEENSYVEMLYEFTQDTSLHGINYMTRPAKYLIRRYNYVVPLCLRSFTNLAYR